MAMLAAAREVAADDAFPYEHRYLTEILKQALVFEEPHGRILRGRESWSLGTLGLPPKPPFGERDLLRKGGDGTPYWQLHFTAAWKAFSEFVRGGDGNRTYYAEKFPMTLLGAAEAVLPVKRVYVVRDPRDSWCSVRSFDRRRGFHGFGRKEGESGTDYLRRYVEWYRFYLRHVRKEGRRDRSVVVRYEDLVREPGRAVTGLEELLGIELDIERAHARCARFRDHRTSHDPGSSVERWRNELESGEAAAFSRRLSGELADFGYGD
jgi:hypothetical protein